MAAPTTPRTDTYGQGAFNADDMARAAVVYLRHWKQTGAAQPARGVRDAARAHLPPDQSGPNAGNVVLWMQPDGTLNPSAEPVEQPDPSDSDASYWLARTIWALGEGYAAFQRADPAFARFLEQRLDLAVGAVDRQVLDAYGQYLQHRRPADARLADRRRRRRLGRGGARARRLRPRRRHAATPDAR